MNAPTHPLRFHPSGTAALERRLRAEVDGQVLFDAFSRGRYSTDASIYQIEPVGVVVPRTEEAARIALQIAVEEGVPVLPRGAGTSQCGQAVGAALVIDNSKHLNQVVAVDPQGAVAEVQPGVVLDQLNAKLRAHGLWYPVDVSTSAQATLGGMAGNNSCGSRSIRYGNMVHNVLGIEAWLPSGEAFWFGSSENVESGPASYRVLVEKVHAIARRQAGEIEARWPKVLRRVQGYNLDMVVPSGPHNLAHLLVGSEGTLAYFKRLRLKLAPLPKQKVLGVCHFPSFHQAMDLTRHIVGLDPDALELVDRTMIELAHSIPQYRDVLTRFVRGAPDAILLVEFAGDDREAQLRKLRRLVELMGDLGLPGSVVEVVEAQLQRDIWEVRKAGLNIMMSMKGDGKPVSFIEDCAVPLDQLAEYTHRVNEIFARHGTRGTWYAHASVGTLHVRPVLNMKDDGARQMRAIAEEVCELVKRFKGAYSGEHGDGLVRSEWIEPILGARLTRALEEIKALFDPHGLMNPGKIVRPSRMDDRNLFRFKPGYATQQLATALDWSEWGGLPGAVEMCNNNGHCRKFDAGTMCPSYRATLDEQHLTRGRANTLRLALSGQVGPDALVSDAMHATMDLCVGCKGCKRECPTGVDMARLKIEFLHQYHRRHGYRLQDKLIAYLPRYAPLAARLGPLLNLRNRLPLLARLSQSWLGLSARRSLPEWRGDSFLGSAPSPQPSPTRGEGASLPPPSPTRGEGASAPQTSPASGAGASVPPLSPASGAGASVPPLSPASGAGAASFPPSPTRGEGVPAALKEAPSPLAGEGGGEGDRLLKPGDLVDAFSLEKGVSREVVLFADTFNNYFEPENLRAAQRVLDAAGYRVHIARPVDGGRPLCCGRTFLAMGMVDEARHEAWRLLTALKPYVERGMPVVGLEPSCLLTLRDEYLVLGLDDDEVGVLAERADLFEEFLADELDAGRFNLSLQPIAQKRALLHGHCHQKAFAAMPAVARVLSLVPELAVQPVQSSCCGMAGAFGYQADHFDVSMTMGEASLFPAVRASAQETLIVADGTSCRQQIRDGTGRHPMHVARVLEQALPG